MSLRGQEELDQYKLTRKEVADYLNISPNAVRMSMRGKNCHNLEYRFNGKQFLFKVPRRDPVITRLVDHPSDHPGTPKSTPGATPIEERTKFESARGVEESIYRARKHLFKKTGEIY